MLTMLIRNSLLPTTRKICCNTFYPQIRYDSNYAKNTPNRASQVWKIYEKGIDKFRKTFPRLSALYSLIYGGTRGMMSDFKEGFGIMNKLAKGDKGMNELTLEQLEFFHKFRTDTRKLIPITLLGILPFGNTLIIPFVYFMPRRAVTHHFWTEHQKKTFPFEDHKERLMYHKPILENFNNCPSGRIPDEVLNDWRHLLAILERGARPEVADVLKVAPLFHRSGPFYLQTLPKTHIIHLIATYGLASLLSPLRKAVEFAGYNLVVDKKIVQRGGPKTLPAEIRSKICYLRGVDSMNMTNEQQVAFLQKWIQLNAKIDISNYSLLLHTPILLGYNAAHTKSDVIQKR